jgi:rhodanese-related sulfurtransferase
MREVDLDTFASAYEHGAEVIDVREPMEYVAGHVPGARLIPMGQLPSRLAELPKGEPVYVICASGNRSLSMADFLASSGYDAWSVAGGTGLWMRTGRRVVAGMQAGERESAA